MRWKPPRLDRGVDQWTDREIQFEEMRANWAKVQSENSPLRRYAPIILSAVFSLVVTLATIYMNQSSAERDRATQAQRWDNERAASALRVYFEHPDLFVGENGAQNLDLLKQTTPEQTMNGIVQAVNNRADAARLKASQEAASIVAQVAPRAAIPNANPAAPAPTAAPVRAEVLKQAENRRYETIERSPSRGLTRPNSTPTAFTVYLQYGPGSQQRATQLQSGLASAGYNVPSADSETTAPAVPQVRYYIATQAAAAAQLAERVKQAIGREPLVRFVGEGKTLPDGIIEVWLPGGMDEVVAPPTRSIREPTKGISAPRSVPARPPPPPGQ